MKEEWGKMKKEKDWLGRDQYVIYKKKEKEKVDSSYDSGTHYDPLSHDSDYWELYLIGFPIFGVVFGLIGGCSSFVLGIWPAQGTRLSFVHYVYPALFGAAVGFVIGVIMLVKYYESKSKS